MRVLQVVHGFPPDALGGTEIYVHDLAQTLARRFDDEVVVLTREQRPDRPELSVRWEQRDRIRVAHVNNTLRHCRRFEDTYRHPGVRQVVSRLLDQIRPDAVHIHHLTGLSTDLVTEARQRLIPTIFTLHDYWLLCQRGQLLDRAYRRCPGPSPDRCARCVGPAATLGEAGYRGAQLVRTMERRLPLVGRLSRGVASSLGDLRHDLSRARTEMVRRLAHVQRICHQVNRLLAPSNTLMDRFLDFGIARSHIDPCELGVDPTPFGTIRRPRSGRRLRVGFLGSLLPSKGPDVLLDAFRRLPLGSASLHLFGDTAPYHGDDSYRRRLSPYLRLPNVHHRGAVPHTRIPEALAAMDVLAVPSTWLENAPMVVREAFLAKVPVVASRLGGLTEAVVHEQSGLFFRPGDPRDLCRTLLRLVREPNLLRRLRGGIPRVRTMVEDADALRRLYRRSRTNADLTVQVPRRPLPVPAVGSFGRRQMAAVVLNYGTPDDTVDSVRALAASVRPPDQIVVVDNGSPDDSEAELRRRLPEATVLQTGENLGFSGGNNLGILHALGRGAQRVLLVNSDVTVDPHCIGRLERALARDPKIGIVGPAVLARSDPGMVASLGITYSELTGRMRHIGFGQRVEHLGTLPRRRVDGVAGCTVLINREVFLDIGLLSEAYFFSFEDLDFCLKARRAGHETVCVGGAVAYHEGGQSIGKRSPRRIYFATRNHLLMAQQVQRFSISPLAPVRNGCILGFNLAHVLLTSEIPRAEGLRSLSTGLWHHAKKKYGDGP